MTNKLKKEIEEEIFKIKPTKEEVRDMSEDEWMTREYPIKCFELGYEQAKLSQKQEDDEKFEKFIKRLEEHRFEMNIMVSKEFDKGFTSALKQFREIINKLTKELNGEQKQ